ncbi:hypothetical protein FNV43_RR11028 [Rhamnella rubrinervis]|uniref:DUF1985 domain-containing protein n=1 Tax=Rhamnella rubrinervis TaxID=2594499 RepID=A0A8K0MH92_9ROSA|nr:hypothetical protein FNV43_RR11028 [Rhamnella rubrinervis]
MVGLSLSGWGPGDREGGRAAELGRVGGGGGVGVGHMRAAGGGFGGIEGVGAALAYGVGGLGQPWWRVGVVPGRGMKDLVFCGGIVHNLIVRQAESLCQNVMEFNFNGKGATFTEKEFGVITGLNMDASFDTLPPPTSNRIRNKYFGASNKVKNANLLMVFNGLRSKDLEEEDDMVKLCLLYVLECDILGKESQSTIKLDNFSMVEDLEYFNQYPWELDSYNATMVSLHKVLSLRNGELNLSSTYSLCGFLLAFQVWGYETIPLLGQLYARKMDDAFPRIYNWESSNAYTLGDVRKSIFDNNKELHVIGKLRPINVEEEYVYSLNNEIPIPPIKRKKRAKEKVDQVQKQYTYYNQEATPVIDDGHTSSTHNFEELKEHIHSMDMKIDRFSHDFINLYNDFNEFKAESIHEFKSLNETIRHYHSDHEGNVLDATNLQVDADDENPHHQFSVNEGDSEVQFVTPSKVPHCDPRLKKRSDKMKSPFIVTTGTQEELKNTLPPPDKFDPKRTVPTEITSKIFNYMTEGEDVYIDYGICEIKKEFFQTLITEAGWLADEVK